ncbi:MAG: hypothetical protein EBS12_05945 [Flavobacteriia bacterium]|nr:hypothetical protein [Flavobacteriia bacterium]
MRSVEETMNVGKKWTIEEENILLQELDDNIDIELIAQAHKRTLGGIIGRQKFIAYNMYLAKAPEDLIIRKTRINKLQLLKVIAKKEKRPKSLAAKPPSLEYEVVEMRKEIRELKTTVSELVEMLKAIYEFEDI